MQYILSNMRVGAAVAAFSVFCVAPARAADAHPDPPAQAPVDAAHAQPATPPAPGPQTWQTAPTSQDPTSQTQQETASAHRLSRQLLRNAGTDHPGEDQLGTGTSITH